MFSFLLKIFFCSLCFLKRKRIFINFLVKDSELLTKNMAIVYYKCIFMQFILLNLLKTNFKIVYFQLYLIENFLGKITSIVQLTFFSFKKFYLFKFNLKSFEILQAFFRLDVNLTL